MNKARRKAIAEIVDKLNQAKEDLDNLVVEEQEALDNLPENMADGEKAGAMQEAVDAMEQAVASLEEALENLEEATNA